MVEIVAGIVDVTAKRNDNERRAEGRRRGFTDSFERSIYSNAFQVNNCIDFCLPMVYYAPCSLSKTALSVNPAIVAPSRSLKALSA